MMNNLIKFAFLSVALIVAAGSTVWAADTPRKHHVIFHVTDSDPVKWNQALNNAGNLQKNIGKENVDIEIVANGPGLDMMKLESTVANRMEDAIKNGVTLMACGATMKATKVAEKDLYQGVKVVPGGVIQIMNREEAGWTYIKI